MILIPVSTSQGALVNETIYKFHRAVMTEAELLREAVIVERVPLGKPLTARRS